jgi:hypothetical protein
MDAATVAALLEVTETSRAALRREEPGAEAPVEARYADILEALQWLVDRAELTMARRLARAGGGWPPDELEQHDQTRATLTRDLPSDQLEGATVRGRGLPPDAVVNYALHDDGT